MTDEETLNAIVFVNEGRIMDATKYVQSAVGCSITAAHLYLRNTLIQNRELLEVPMPLSMQD